MTIADALSIRDIERLAKRRLPRVVYEGIASGVEDEHGLTRNEAEFQRYRLLPRHLVDVSERDQSTTLFARRYASPFGISPTGIAGIFRRDAELMLAKAASAARVPFVMSGASMVSIEGVARIDPENTWFQIIFCAVPGMPASRPSCSPSTIRSRPSASVMRETAFGCRLSSHRSICWKR
jgi:(S)-mandelate dehydrogenase